MNTFALAGLGFFLVGAALTGWLLYSAWRFKQSVHDEYDPPEGDM